MLTPKLTPAQQRRMRELDDAIERIEQNDLNYFARFPNRKHRVGEPDRAEIEQPELIGAGIMLSPDNQHYRAVRYLTPYSWLSLSVGGPAEVDPDSLDEEMSRAIFKYAAPDELRIFLRGGHTRAEMFAIIQALNECRADRPCTGWPS
ncbi:hypothetical protein [Bradyrhizobium sp. DASA03120]|uniref:hypothetical protein n=1 Tax=Bradyrhizobium sp. SMVTL-02 TaxID=3395917 RepID=UPI003F70D0CB